METHPKTFFNLEQEALASYNYLESLLDPATGFTYFDVFMTNPAEAAHDWPDFLDVPARSAETSVLLRHMTGKGVATEAAFFRRILGFQEADGLFNRPETSITVRAAVCDEQALVMGALLAKAIGDGDREAESRTASLVGGIGQWQLDPAYFSIMLIRPLVRAYEAFGISQALESAKHLRDILTGERPLFRADGSFEGHVHSHLYAAAGLTELGRLTGDDGLIAAMDCVFRVMRSRSTEFGFVPELTERQDDVIACETCCLMDYIHLALALARTGRTEYFDDIERAVRNHLGESRVRHGEWLPASPEARDEELILRASLQRKVVGAYAGWSSPNHILAYDEFLPEAWVKSQDLAPIYLHKVRALQNCCGPSGPKALYIAWQHAARVEGETLRINLLMDRSLPEAEVHGREPHEGRVEVALSAPLRIALRLPRFASPQTLAVSVNDVPVKVQFESGYAITPRLKAGDRATFTYPLPEREELVTIGNDGFQQYRCAVKWRGSTVLNIEPGDNPTTGRSNLMADPVRLYYGAQGPHPIYCREGLLESAPKPAPLHSTPGPDIW
jgi:hypothetical protein